MLLLLLACASGLPVEVAGDVPLATVDPGALSFAVDTAQALGGVFWNPDDDGEPEVPVEPFDFSDARIRGYAEALAPATLRVGGTAADFVFIDLSENPVAEPPEGYSLVLTAERWAAIADFASDLGLELLFTLNAGPGPRGEDGAWDPSQAEALIARAAQRGDPVRVWELGNEVNAYRLFHGLSLSEAQYGEDLAALAAIAGDAAVAGPASAYWPQAGEFVDFLPGALEAGGESLDVITWHYYPQQSERCPVQLVPAEPETMLDPERLDEVAVWAAEVEAARDTWAPHADIWLGETGNAQCGGAPGVSDTFAGSVWWVDQLGLLSERGHQVSVRQTLIGSDYGLLSEPTPAPTPDYWASMGWNWAMGEVVLSVTHDAGADLRAYAHCAPEGGVGFAFIHLGEAPVSVDLGGQAEWMVLEPFAGLDSRAVTFNGQGHTEVPSDARAELLEALVRTRGGMELPGPSVSFARRADLEVPACP